VKIIIKIKTVAFINFLGSSFLILSFDPAESFGNDNPKKEKVLLCD